MSIPQRYQSLSILLYFVLFGIAKCVSDNVICSSSQNCQSSQSFYASYAGQSTSYTFTLSAGYQMYLDIAVSKNEQDWDLAVGSLDLSSITVTGFVDGKSAISPYTAIIMSGKLYLSQTSANSRTVRLVIKNENFLLPTQIDVELQVARYVSYKSSSGTKIPWGTIIIAVAAAIVLIIIISITACCIRRRRRLALQKRLQAANRSALDPIVNNTQLNNSSFQQQNMSYMQDSSFSLQQYGQPAKPQLEFAQPVPQYNQFIQPQPQPQPQPQIYELQPAPQMYMPTYPQQPQVQIQVQPQQIMIQPPPQGY